jgi:nitrite reductase/ring-hydroxylating ferredoxin subunit
VSGDHLLAAHAAELLEGTIVHRELDGRGLALVRVGDEVYAVDDRCTHEAARLSDGFVEGTTIECPHHGARFDLRSGAALCLPAVRPLAVYPVRLEGDLVWVELTGTATEERDVDHG